MIGRSAVNGRYNNGPKTLPWDISALRGEFCILIFNFAEKNVCFESRI
jgi:hypothetical protein